MQTRKKSALKGGIRSEQIGKASVKQNSSKAGQEERKRQQASGGRRLCDNVLQKGETKQGRRDQNRGAENGRARR